MRVFLNFKPCQLPNTWSYIFRSFIFIELLFKIIAEDIILNPLQMWLELPRGQLVLQRISANALQNASTSAHASKVGSNAKKDAIQRTKSAPTSDFGISIVDFI